jgi:hypothetical protein
MDAYNSVVIFVPFVIMLGFVVWAMLYSGYGDDENDRFNF